MLKQVALTALVLAGAVAGTAPKARADDAADVKSAMTGFLKAVQNGDDKTAKAAVAAAPEYASAVSAYLDLALATIKLQKAAEAKFGSSAAKNFGTISGSTMESRLKSIENATVKIAGESAIVTIPADEPATQPAEGAGSPAPAPKPAAKTVILHKSGNTWKLDGASLFNLTPEKMKATEKNVALAAKQTAISNQTIQEINAGQYAAAVDAFEKFWDRSAKAAHDLDAPATAPATKPASP